jgi:hypothetical protein
VSDARALAAAYRCVPAHWVQDMARVRQGKAVREAFAEAAANLDSHDDLRAECLRVSGGTDPRGGTFADQATAVSHRIADRLAREVSNLARLDEEAGGGSWWHWSPETIQPGDRLVPGSQRPDGGYWCLDDFRAQRVWLWADPLDALEFGGDGHLYEVHADAVRHEPTDDDLDPDNGLDAGLPDQYHTAHGVVLREVTGAELDQLRRRLHHRIDRQHQTGGVT